MDIEKIDNLRPLQPSDVRGMISTIANGQNISNVTVGVPSEVVAKLTECILTQTRTIDSLIKQNNELLKQLKNK